MLLFLPFAPDNVVDLGAAGRVVFGLAFAFNLFIPAELLSALYGSRIHRFWETLQSEVARNGDVLTMAPEPKLDQHSRVLLAYLIYSLVVLLCFAVWQGSTWIEVLAQCPAVVTLLLMILLLISSLILLHRREYSLRVHALIPGLWSILGMLGLLLLLWLGSLVGSASNEKMRFLEKAYDACGRSASPWGLSSQEIARFEGVAAEFRGAMLAVVFTYLFVGGMVFLGFRRAVRMARLTAPTNVRLKSFSAKSDTVMKAASGKGFLQWFRFAFGGVWLLVGGLFLFAAPVAGMAFISATLGPDHAGILPTSKWVEVSQHLVSLAFAGTGHSFVAVLCTRFVWAFLSGLIVFVFASSVAQLGRQRFRQYKELLKRRTHDRHILNVVRDLSSKLKLEPPIVCIRNSDSINAGSHEFGLFQRKHIIEITTGAIEKLSTTPGLLEVILAHELAHLRLGHVKWINYLRWLGRVTLVGDSFVFSLADSWGYELRADQCAILEASIPRPLLLGCLLVLEEQAIQQSFIKRQETRSQSPSATPGVSLDKVENHESVSLSPFRCFMKQYTQPFDSMYWHPSIAARREAVRAMK